MGRCRAVKVVRGWLIFSLGAFALAASCGVASAQAAEAGSREALVAHLDSLARERLSARREAVSSLRTAEDARRRQAWIRETVLRLIGGLPETRGDLVVRLAGALEGDGFRVERVIYDSLPGLHVTANVYVPASGSGPFPAVLLSAGHSPGGKSEQYEFAATLARHGFVALAWDPVGQGERLQHFDAELGASKVGRPTGEHGHDSAQVMLTGDHVSRYFVWDAMRGLDYLSSREDVDRSRLGAFGCSGGGTVTAYLAALDDRVAAAASACYMTTFERLLATVGPQDGEQSIPGFVAQGLDFADWVAAAAPRPYAIVSTTEDMFPFEGARETFEEAKRFYGLLNAADRLQWITGPGGHGALQPILPDIVTFFVKALKGGGPAPVFSRVAPVRPEDLLCTESGQVSTSLGGETIRSVNRARAGAVRVPVPLSSAADLERMARAVRDGAREAAAVSVVPRGAPPTMSVTASAERNGYRLDSVLMRVASGLELAGLLARPVTAASKPPVLLLEAESRATFEQPGTELERLARAGHVVLLLPMRPAPHGTEEIKSPLLGTAYLLSLRAFLVGRTLLGLRVDDALAAVAWLSSGEHGAGGVTMYGRGPAAPVALHAAALDEHVAHVIVEQGLASYRLVVEQPLHRNVSEVMVPGALARYDLPDLAMAASPRRVTVLAPVDAMGNTLRHEAFRREWARVFDTDAALGQAGRVRLSWRGPRDPLPVE